MKLTINGVRKLPLDISDELATSLRDPNSEFRITLIASPTGEEQIFEEGADSVIKLKTIHVESITSNV